MNFTAIVGMAPSTPQEQTEVCFPYNHNAGITPFELIFHVKVKKDFISETFNRALNPRLKTSLKIVLIPSYFEANQGYLTYMYF